MISPASPLNAAAPHAGLCLFLSAGRLQGPRLHSQLPPPLPVVAAMPGPEHIQVIRGIQAGDCALSRVWGSLKENPR